MTELRRGREAIARLAAIVDGSEDAIIGYGLDGVITDWNKAATRLYGYSAEEAIGRNASILAPQNRPDELTMILSSVAAGERLRQVEGLRSRKDGSLVEVSSSLSPICAQDGTIIGVSSIVRDITGRKRIEEELRKSEERFRLVSRATKDAISDLDIRTGRVWRSENFWKRFGYSPKVTEPDVDGWRKLIHPEDRDRVWNAFPDCTPAAV